MSHDELKQLEHDQEEKLQAQIDSFGERSVSAITTASVIIAGLSISYLVFRSLSSDKPSPKKKKKKFKKDIVKLKEQLDDPKPSLIANITQDVMRDGTHFLLAFAGQKLAEYINQRK